MIVFMSAPLPYSLSEPTGPAGHAVFSSPHSGRWYPPDLLRHSRLGPLALRASEDAFVDRLFETAPCHGAPLIRATVPRAYVDLNRGADELDPAVIEGVRLTGLNPRVAAGLGVIPRVVAEGAPIYVGKISRADAAARLAGFHTPYHEAVTSLMRRARDEHGLAILYDCHSMPRDALRSVPRVRGRRPEIVLGDRFGGAAAPWVMAEAQSAFEAAGFAVVRNAPFAGGYITQRYGRPTLGWHAIQIEIDRGLYLDERRVEPLPALAALRDTLGEVIRRLCRRDMRNTALAAE
jgi:N-formylglutamate deformylase